MGSELNSIQVVAFTTAPPTLDALDLWSKVLNRRPESFNPIGPGATQAMGKIDGLTLNLQAQVNRIDVIVTPATDDIASESNPQIKDLQGAVELASRTLLSAAEGQKLWRPAIVLQVFDEFNDISSAIENVAKALPNIAFPRGTTDINYQITTGRQSYSNSAISISRITRWNTAVRQLVQFNPATGPIQVTSGFAVLRYIDVYADQSAVVPTDQFATVFDEVVREAELILLKGYDAL